MKPCLQHTYLLLLLVLFGCGNTLVNQANTPEVINGNSVSRVTSEFKLIKIKSASDFDQLPRELSSYKTQMGQFDFYLAQSPTQSSGGFFFEFIQKTDPLIICLKKPSPLSAVTSALSNPIALIKVTKGFNVKMDLSFCERNHAYRTHSLK
jgi:hypothetical protein